MIRRFRAVVPHVLYRGSSPNIDDVKHLKEKLGIKKIVSLDKKTGDKIDRACKMLGIHHEKMYLNGDQQSLSHFLSLDLKRLFLEGGPTFVHCAAGKDRTGLAVALVKCKYLGVSPEKAIEEAKSLGFGIGVPPKIIHLYENAIRSCKKSNDTNNADIVSNERTYIGDNRDSFLDEGHQGSFSPYLDETQSNPQDPIYKNLNDQSPTRQNYPDYKEKKEELAHHKDDYYQGSINDVPLSGIYNNDAGVHGVGPAEPVGGFLYDQASTVKSMIKKAYSVQMSYNVSDSEKQQAEKALLYFKSAENVLAQGSDYLDIMKTPFKDNPDMTEDDVMKARAVIRRFRDKSIDNFDKFKRISFECVNLMQMFSSDTQTLKLMKSYITSIDDLEVKVNHFADLFTDLQSKDFPKNVVSAIEDIQKECDSIDEIIDERIKTHIQTNILATNWVDSVSNDLQMKIEKKTPLIVDLFNKRQNQLNQSIEERSTVGN